MTEEQLTYLKTWSERTRSDAMIADKVPAMIQEIINNLDELDKYLANLKQVEL